LVTLRSYREANMSSTVNPETVLDTQTAYGVDLKLEVVVLVTRCSPATARQPIGGNRLTTEN
jgi:hypothetical protein